MKPKNVFKQLDFISNRLCMKSKSDSKKIEQQLVRLS